MPSTHRTGGLFLIIGYLGVVGGTVGSIVSSWGFGYPENTVYQVALGLGIGLAGLACWRWTVAHRASELDPTAVRGPTRWMSAASLVLAAAPAALVYQTYDNHRQFERFNHQGTLAYPHYRLIMTSGVAFTVGLLLASCGYWILSNATGASNVASHSSIASNVSAGSD